MIKRGEVWKTDSRKGPLTIRVLEDIPDRSSDDFFDAEIVEGRAKFLSKTFNKAQRTEGYGVAGSVISFRASLTDFIERLGFMPIAADETNYADLDPRAPR